MNSSSPTHTAFLRAMRRHMRAYNLTQSQLARTLDVTPQAVNQWLSGKTLISYATMDRFAAKTGTRPILVLIDVDEMTYEYEDEEEPRKDTP